MKPWIRKGRSRNAGRMLTLCPGFVQSDFQIDRIEGVVDVH